MSVIARLLPDNPVLTKELRVRMRGARAYWIMFGYLGFLSLVLMFSYYSWWTSVHNTGGGSAQSSELGGQIFIYILVTQIFLVLFITPAITSGSLTIEREQRTMDMLDLTRMSRRSIIIGKLLAAVSFTALLIITSLPLVSICFMLGSVDPAQVLSAYLEMLLGSFLVGAMGLMWSSIAKTTTLAVIYTYLTMLLMTYLGCMAFVFSMDRSGGLVDNVGQAVGVPWFGNEFFGIKTIDGAGFVFFCVLGGIVMATVARVRLEMFPERKGYLLRGLTLVIVGLELMGANLWWLNQWYHRGAQAVQTQMHPPTGVLQLTAIYLMFLVPVFATGELKSFEARHFGKHLLWGWTPKGLSRGKLISGLPFLLILTLFCLGLYALSFMLMGKSGDINAPNPLYTTRALPTPPPPPVTVTPSMRGGQFRRPVLTPSKPAPPNPDILRASSPEYAAKIGRFPQAAIVLLAFVFGFSLFCFLLSVVFRSRWVAWLLAYVGLVAIWVLPVSSRGDGSGAKTGILVNAYYLDPLQAIYQMTEPVSYYQYNHFLNIKEASMWRDVTRAWLGIGALSFLLALPLIFNERRKNAEIPFEEMVANA